MIGRGGSNTHQTFALEYVTWAWSPFNNRLAHMWNTNYDLHAAHTHLLKWSRPRFPKKYVVNKSCGQGETITISQDTLNPDPHTSINTSSLDLKKIVWIDDKIHIKYRVSHPREFALISQKTPQKQNFSPLWVCPNHYKHP